jgi:hypothetical protein
MATEIAAAMMFQFNHTNQSQQRWHQYLNSESE